ncbi:MAG: hypothetical protein QOE60_2305, partial [Thermoleophilaceae bacterium]|nr:hypothetical protein [Thermoleophilaceae bacterium]
MTDSTTQTTQAGPTRRRIGLIMAGAVAGVLALGALGLGAGALWADGQKNDQGYLTTDSEPFAAGSRALATDDLDVDLNGVDWLVDSGDFGKVQLQVASQGDRPVFVGIGRTNEVASYLRGVDHTRVTDVNSDPFKASYRRESGNRRPAAPAQESFWAASTQGHGTQKLDWRVKDGNWSVVVMNADGSRGVAADIRAGAKISFLDELGWSALGAGGALLIGALTLIVR